MKLLVKQDVGDIHKDHLKILDNVITFLQHNIDGLEFLPFNLDAEQGDYQQAFQRQTGIIFTPANYRHYRLRLLSVVDALLYIHTSSNDSDAYELSYNLSSIHPKPVFFAVWRGAPIKSPLLKELDQDYPVTYCQFSHPRELLEGFKRFLQEHGKDVIMIKAEKELV
ncbi:hypothetical protein HWV01_18810 [Moritella sp. 5]|uniref:hypothetical protein n=1 Tax=Moritella sp. 5 TaxID=2746231 RepID=UPI001BAA1F8C|nr:hypothetical protein [Moritella sp. 5]QUM82187.1 hypothetical protein HWV01_18810 [Moritella sp. 5]